MFIHNKWFLVHHNISPFAENLGLGSNSKIKYKALSSSELNFRDIHKRMKIVQTRGIELNPIQNGGQLKVTKRLNTDYKHAQKLIYLFSQWLGEGGLYV